MSRTSPIVKLNAGAEPGQAAVAGDFLRVPPFPRSRPVSLNRSDKRGAELSDDEVDRLIDRLRELKVGGTYWAAQPPLPDAAYRLVRLRDAGERRKCLDDTACGQALAWTEPGWPDTKGDAIVGPCDPWHVLSRAAEIVVDADDEAALVAALAGVPVRTIGEGRFQELGRGRDALRDCIRRLASNGFANPFTGEPMTFAQAAELSGFWRALIDSNRDITQAVGFAFWKRATVAPLLWGGHSAVRFSSKVRSPQTRDRVAIWKSRTDSASLAALERSGARLFEVEDGFIRSVGLGADCVPPLSIVVDRLGIYFDPSGPSDLERLLEDREFTAEMLERARSLRELIVELGITKYGVGGKPLKRRADGKTHLLVAGQVEDDRAVITGGGPQSNLELLRKVRDGNPGAYILYKPHPDVEAGHRRGRIADSECLTLADEIVRDAPISSLIALVDEVHVNTSLAGFEALLRGRAVATWGAPFYAGWGLTRDLGPIPERRTARRSLDELVSAALLLYPRYVDPVTGLPCPPEILVRRMAESRPGGQSGVVQLRKLQGRWNRAVAELRS